MATEDNVLKKAKLRFTVIHTSYKKLTIENMATDCGIKLSRMYNDKKTKIESSKKKRDAFKKQFLQIHKRLLDHIAEKADLEKMDTKYFTEEEITHMKSAFTDAAWANTYKESLMYNGGFNSSSTVGGT